MNSKYVKTLKRIIIAIVCGIGIGFISFLISGRQFDAGAFVKGNLDVIYLNQYNDDYLKMLKNKPSEEEKEQTYNEGIQVEVNFFCQYFQIENVSDAVLNRIADDYKQIYRCSKYEVVSSEKAKDSYTVVLRVYPMDIIEKVCTEDLDGFLSNWKVRCETGDLSDPSLTEADLEEAWADGILHLIEARMSSIDYLDPQELTLNITKDPSDGLYSLTQDDLSKIDNLIISY